MQIDPRRVTPNTRQLDSATAKVKREPPTRASVPPRRAVSFPERVTELKYVRSLGGGSGSQAGLYEDAKGRKFVRKHDGSDTPSNAPGHTREEVLTDKALEALGVTVACSRHYVDRGIHYKVSAFIPHAQGSGELLRHPTWGPVIREIAAEDFAAHALLANWDANADYANMVVRIDRNGTPGKRESIEVVMVDAGGGLRRRSRGALKGRAFGSFPIEPWSMRHPPPSGLRNRSADYVGDLGWFRIVEGMREVLARTPRLLRAVESEPEVKAILERRLAHYQYLVKATDDLKARGMGEGAIDRCLKQVTQDAINGQALPQIRHLG